MEPQKERKKKLNTFNTYKFTDCIEGNICNTYARMLNKVFCKNKQLIVII